MAEGGVRAEGVEVVFGEGNLTMRDEFAIAALTGLIANPDVDLAKPLEKFAAAAYQLADCMLKARKDQEGEK